MRTKDEFRRISLITFAQYCTNHKPRDANQDTPPAVLTPSANLNPTPARPRPQFGAFIIGLLQHQHPSIKVCYGCGGELKRSGRIPKTT